MSSSALSKNSLVAVIGSGTMGAGIAQVAALAGHAVALYDSRTDAVPKAIQGIRQSFEKLVSKRKLSTEAAESASARLRAATSLTELRGSGIVVEAVVEDLEVKRQLFAELEDIVDAKCVLATNTSSLSITAIAAALKAPQRLVGMHFFNPVPVMELVEVISGMATDSELLKTVYATAAAWGKTPVYAKSTPGFIVNRVARPYYGEALLLLAEHAASPATIDAVMREAGGFRMGPFELMDLVGLDIGFAVSQSIFGAYFGDPRYRPSLIQQEMVRAGFLGRKTKRGFYEYGDNALAPTPDTEPPAPKPERVTLHSAGSLTEALAQRLSGSGLTIARAPSRSDHGDAIEMGDVILAVTDGRSATQRAYETGHRNFIVVDLAFDYLRAARLAITKASGCDERAYLSAVGLLQAAGYAVSGLKDVPGIAVMRTVAMLINEAADVVNQGVATVSDVDTAMRKGVNYPRGPLAWADDLGVEAVQIVLTNLSAHYGGDRYRVSSKIRHLVWSGGSFWGESAV
ncbi:MAG: 3-hydroxyacyl-CoA dehydrogenase [Candidatus Acidiferrales bacterium]